MCTCLNEWGQQSYTELQRKQQIKREEWEVQVGKQDGSLREEKGWRDILNLFIHLGGRTSKEGKMLDRDEWTLPEKALEQEDRKTVKAEALTGKQRKTITSHSWSQKRIWEKKEILLPERRTCEKVLAIRFGLNKVKKRINKDMRRFVGLKRFRSGTGRNSADDGKRWTGMSLNGCEGLIEGEIIDVSPLFSDSQSHSAVQEANNGGGGVEVGDRQGSIAERQDSGISEDKVDSSETLWGESRLGRLMSLVVPYGVEQKGGKKGNSWRSGRSSMCEGRRQGEIPKRIQVKIVLKISFWRYSSSLWDNLLYYQTEKVEFHILSN